MASPYAGAYRDEHGHLIHTMDMLFSETEGSRFLPERRRGEGRVINYIYDRHIESIGCIMVDVMKYILVRGRDKTYGNTSFLDQVKNGTAIETIDV